MEQSPSSSTHSRAKRKSKWPRKKSNQSKKRSPTVHKSTLRTLQKCILRTAMKLIPSRIHKRTPSQTIQSRLFQPAPCLKKRCLKKRPRKNPSLKVSRKGKQPHHQRPKQQSLPWKRASTGTSC